MPVVIRHRIIVWLCIALLIGTSGCALAPAPLSERLRAQLGTIGVVSARFIPEAAFRPPAKGSVAGAGRGAARGAATGFGYGLEVAARSGGCSGAFCGLAVLVLLGIMAVGTTVGAVVGGVHGAATAEAAVKVAEEEAALKHALAELRIQEAMRDHVLRVGWDQTRHSLVVLTDKGPTVVDERVSYRATAGQAIDTVLEISVLSLGLTARA